MLQQLEIHNIALIDNVSIVLESGLNIMTGETGAGKSIIIDSINAILGERVTKDLIRTGEEKAVVEAVFQVDNEKLSDIFENMGIEPEEDGTLIVSREFTMHGKNICRINGKMATVSMIKEIGERIIDIHGQHDNQSLLKPESHIELLDSFGGEEILSLKQRYTALLNEYMRIKGKLREIAGDRKDFERRIDMTRYQIDEIKKAKLKIGEEENLNKQRLRQSNSEKIVTALSAAYELLFSGNNIRSSALDSLAEVLSELNSVSKLDDKFADAAGRLENITYQLDDIVEFIRKERDGIEFNPDLLEQIEERMDLIYRLKRKYGGTVEEILKYCSKLEKELDDMVKSEETVAVLQERLDKLNDELYGAAGGLNSARKRAAALLEGKIGSELDELEMKKAQFKVGIQFDSRCNEDGERKFNSYGLDKVEFLISPNAGEPLKPLSKIASGGEMSRIMLAIKNILANVDRIPTLIFDEIDMGVSGRAAQKVGEKLSNISKSHQVICVTHLAQIACMADSHYLIEKKTDNDSTRTIVAKLKEKEIKNEIARIVGGAVISDITLKHAEEMLKSAQKFKKSL